MFNPFFYFCSIKKTSVKTQINIPDIKSSKKNIVTIGTFDGVHLGHKKIIDRLLKSSKAENLESTVLTFSEHPRSVLKQDKNISLLNTTDEKIQLLQKLGLDNLVILDFESIAELSGEEFVKNILVDKLNIQKIIIGYDHRFGKNRSSDIHDLIYFGKKYHFDVEQISAEELNDITISSTKIRNAISNGDIKLANSYLGYNFFFSGKVTQGKQLGRTIQFPTANIEIQNSQKITPKTGVYVVKGEWNGKESLGMMNIGYRPTVNGTSLSIEVHFLDINEDLYNKEITIYILDFIRDEKKFNSLEELKEQLQKDKNRTLAFLNKEH